MDKKIFCILSIILSVLSAAPFYSFSKEGLFFKVSSWIVSFDFENSCNSFKENIESFDEVNFFIYNFDKEGNIRKANGVKEELLKKVLKIARLKNIKVIPTIVNDIEYDENLMPSKLKDPCVIHDILIDKNRLKRHILQIMEIVDFPEIDGIEIDYENIHAQDTYRFILFIKELSVELKKKAKTLSIVVQPKTHGSFKDELGGQDWIHLTRYADRLKIMCYNLHGTFSNAGPISTPDFVEKVIIFAKSLNLPEDKIYIALPLHGFIWSKKEVSSLTFEKACALANMKNATIRWSRKYFSHHFQYREGKKNYEIWFEDAESFARKLEMLKKHRIKNVSLWRLGGEDRGIYKKL